MNNRDEEYIALGKAVWHFYRRHCISDVADAVRYHEIPSPDTLPCVDCGAQAMEYEHRNYSRPLDIVPICHRCNLRRGPAELNPETVVSHLIQSENFPYENSRLRGMAVSRWRQSCACCDPEVTFSHTDESVKIILR